MDSKSVRIEHIIYNMLLAAKEQMLDFLFITRFLRVFVSIPKYIRGGRGGAVRNIFQCN